MSSFVALFATDKVSGRRDRWDKSEDLPCDLMDFHLLEHGSKSTYIYYVFIVSLKDNMTTRQQVLSGTCGV